MFYLAYLPVLLVDSSIRVLCESVRAGKTVVMLVSFLVSTSLMALPLKLSIPEDFDVKFLNGEAYKSSLVQSEVMQTISLSYAVPQQIVLVYSQVFDDGEDFDIVKSKPFMIEFVPSDKGTLSMIFEAPNNYDSARTFAKQPLVNIVQSGQSLAPKHSYDVDRRSWLESFVSPLKSDSAADQSLSDSSIKVATDQISSHSHSALSQLFFWWDSASASERAEFLKYVSDSASD
jgi:uncharacterized protein YccT (UPF0319 family)